MKQVLLGVVAAASFAVAASAVAVPINGNPVSGLVAPTSTITFTEIVLADNTPISNQYAGLGIASLSGFFYNGCQNVCVVTPPSGSHPELSNFANVNTSIFTGSQTIEFTSAINGAAFQFASNGGTYTFTALLNGSAVESFNGNGSAWGYYGFTGINLDEIQISSPSAFLLDNLELGAPVPAPGVPALLAAGLAAFGLRRRKNC